MGDIELRSNTNAIPGSDLTSQEFLSTKTWSSSDFNCSLNGMNKKGVEGAETSSGPLSLQAGIGEMITSASDNQDSLASLDSSIKYFKSTVQHLFDDFYSNFNHFDEFEKTVSGILMQNNNELDIDALIKGIMEQRTEEANSNKIINTSPDRLEEAKDDDDVFASLGNSKEETRISFLPKDATLGTATNNCHGRNISNCYAFKEVAPYEQKMRQLLSDIEINKNVRVKTSQVSFNDNLKKLNLTRKKLQSYLQGHKRSEKEAVGCKYDKKHSKLESLDEEHREQQANSEESSFLDKICHFLCKKFRRGPYLD